MSHRDYIRTGFDIHLNNTGNPELDTWLDQLREYVLNLESAVNHNVYKCLDDCGWVGTQWDAEVCYESPHSGESFCPDCGRPICDYLFEEGMF